MIGSTWLDILTENYYNQLMAATHRGYGAANVRERDDEKGTGRSSELFNDQREINDQRNSVIT